MRVLVIVDDTPDIRRMVRTLLERSGVAVDAEAATVEEALGLLDPDAHGVVILDHHLTGGVTGLEGAPLVRSRAPWSRVVLFSAADLSEEVASNPAVDAFVSKDRVLDLPAVVRQLHRELDARRSVAPAEPVRPSAAGRLLARWLVTPAWRFGTLPPPLEAAEVLDQLLVATPARREVVLRFIAASSDVDFAVAHLVALRRLVDGGAGGVPGIDADVIDGLLVETASVGIAATRRVALIDPLTGLGNRRALETDLSSALARAQRADEQLSLLYLDLVGLKTVNDRHGHEEGDRTLRAFALALETSLRAGDGSYRVGGDEFVAILPHTRTSDAAILAMRLSSSGAPEFTWGLANTERDGFDGARLTRIADVRMLAKRHERAGAPDTQQPSAADLVDAETHVDLSSSAELDARTDQSPDWSDQAPNV